MGMSETGQTFVSIYWWSISTPQLQDSPREESSDHWTLCSNSSWSRIKHRPPWKDIQHYPLKIRETFLSESGNTTNKTYYKVWIDMIFFFRPFLTLTLHLWWPQWLERLCLPLAALRKDISWMWLSCHHKQLEWDDLATQGCWDPCGNHWHQGE